MNLVFHESHEAEREYLWFFKISIGSSLVNPHEGHMNLSLVKKGILEADNSMPDADPLVTSVHTHHPSSSN